MPALFRYTSGHIENKLCEQKIRDGGLYFAKRAIPDITGVAEIVGTYAAVHERKISATRASGSPCKYRKEVGAVWLPWVLEGQCIARHSMCPQRNRVLSQTQNPSSLSHGEACFSKTFFGKQPENVKTLFNSQSQRLRKLYFIRLFESLGCFCRKFIISTFRARAQKVLRHQKRSAFNFTGKPSKSSTFNFRVSVWST